MHNLNQRADGSYAFYSVKEPGWHKLGNVVERPVADPEARRLAGLDWLAEEMDICRSDMVGVSDYKAIIRSDTRETLGVVSSSYTPVQNHELFEWMRGLESIGSVTIETAGAIGAGELVWVLARCDALKFDINGDLHFGYLSLINGHGGNRKLVVCPSDVRAQCFNTVSMILAQKRHGTIASGWELLHRPGIHKNLEVIQNLYAETAKAHKITQEMLALLASKPLTDEAVKRMFTEPFLPKAKPVEVDAEPVATEDVVEDEKDESVRAKLIRQERESRLQTILASDTCNTGNAGSLYAVLQAVTEFAQYDVVVRPRTGGERGIEEARFRSNLDGRASDIKRAATKLALELAGV
jgi:phage/plasmid-like protein (TIGR03299 family)